MNKKRFRCLEDTGVLKKDDILVEDERFPYIYCTDKVCTTIMTIEKNMDKFELLDVK